MPRPTSRQVGRSCVEVHSILGGRMCEATDQLFPRTPHSKVEEDLSQTLAVPPARIREFWLAERAAATSAMPGGGEIRWTNAIVLAKCAAARVPTVTRT